MSLNARICKASDAKDESMSDACVCESSWIVGVSNGRVINQTTYPVCLNGNISYTCLAMLVAGSVTNLNGGFGRILSTVFVTHLEFEGKCEKYLFDN